MKTLRQIRETLALEGGRRLDPASVEVELGEAVVQEEVGAHALAPVLDGDRVTADAQALVDRALLHLPGALLGADLGVEVRTLPLTPPRVWELLQRTVAR